MLEALRGRVDWVSRSTPGMAIIEVEPGLADVGERMLAATEDLEFIERDSIQYARPAIVPDDPIFPQQWDLARICMPAAWDILRNANPLELVAVLDSGVRYTIPEMTPNMSYNSLEMGNDEDQSGVVGDYWGASFDNDFFNDSCANPRNDPWDRCGHGTQMASIIDAVGNNTSLFSGAVWSCKILPVQVYGQLVHSTWIAKGMEYAVFGRGSRLVNCSFIVYDDASVIKLVMLNTPNVLYVCAAGNDCVDLDTPLPPGCTPNIQAYPAQYHLANQLVVGGTDANDNPNSACPGCPFYDSGTNYGKTKVDVFGPSTNNWSLNLNGTASNVGTGTSNATALTTGLALLLWTQDPTRTVADIKTKIMNSVDVFPSLSNKCVTSGRINAARALGGGC